MRQIVYISTLHRNAMVDIDDLMVVLQRNNARIDALTAQAAPVVRATFEGFVRVRRTA